MNAFIGDPDNSGVFLFPPCPVNVPDEGASKQTPGAYPIVTAYCLSRCMTESGEIHMAGSVIKHTLPRPQFLRSRTTREEKLQNDSQSE